MTDAPSGRVRIAYTPTPMQAKFHQASAAEVLYGGAAGGGKSAATRHEAVAFALEVPGSRQVIIRRTWPDLNRDMLPKMRLEVPPQLATYNANDHEWRFTNGSVIELGYMANDADVARFQGAEYQRCYVDEAGQHTEYRLRYLMSRLRAAGDVKARMTALGYEPAMRLTANPGGVGHAYLKARFIDPHPHGHEWTPEPDAQDPNPGTRLYIPARVTDNPHLDASYEQRLDALPEDERRALRDGDWDVYAGMRFGDWRRDTHVIPYDDIADLVRPGAALVRAVGVDYGMDAPFAALWGVKAHDGLVIIYRELYQAGLTPAEQAALIRDAEAEGEVDERGGRMSPIAVDPSTWARNPNQVRAPAGAVGQLDDGAPPVGSIADTYRRVLGGRVVKARNERLASIAMIADKLRVRRDGAPRLLVADTCLNLIRTLPALPRDRRNPELFDTGAEDHAVDAARYLLMQLEGQHPVEGGRRSQVRAGVSRYGVVEDPVALKGF